MKPQINFDDFAKLDMRVGLVMEAEVVEGSTKLVQLKVDFGPDFAKASPGRSEVGVRTIYAGIKEWYPTDDLVGRKLIFVVNLAPKVFKIKDKEYVSEGMLLAASAKGSGEPGAAGGDRAYLYSFGEDLPPGTILR